MPFAVLLTDDAVNDLEELHEYIATHDSSRKAEAWLRNVDRAVTRLSESPNRGSYPKELLAVGIREYRQIFFKPYRILYRVIEKKVYIFLITDGRRDMRSLLERRLFDAD